MWQPWEWVRPAAGDVRFVHGGGGYLCLKDVTRRTRRAAAASARAHGARCVFAESDAADVREEALEEALEVLELQGDEEPPDPSALASAHLPECIHFYDYHVVHSDTYGVPVLYLCARSSGGALLPTESVWHDVCPPHSWPPGLGAAAAHDDWLSDSGLPTPAPHPVTGDACLMLHPCRTHQFMSQALALRPSPADPDLLATLANNRDTPGRAHEDGMRGTGSVVSDRYLILWLSVFGAAVGLRLPLSVLSLALPQ